MRLTRSPRACARRGNATVIAVITLFVIGSLAGMILIVSQRHSGEIAALTDQNRAFFVADLPGGPVRDPPFRQQVGREQRLSNHALGHERRVGQGLEPDGLLH